ncbi:MAG: tRNA (guanosine(46)-N7)-methyltransferase TrmB [Planctomycetaceae bacterium]|nr:tRNA (guanosine(46)-N7)-methyltransferase TrmB [Planctomycetaceae bacterium]|tara:strand:+ start:8401 stop:9042 length:642 start_codon:yes stop_codon:yes gene_type:complete
MGRRALGKINAQLDLTRHLFQSDGLPQPWDPQKIFSTNCLPEVEIGSGKGLFLQRHGTARPEKNLLGIEISLKYARFAASRLARSKVDNARVVHADARHVFSEIFPDASLAAVHIYFPDPWWKKRHHKRRLLNPDFVAQLSRTIIRGGHLHFWTDVEETFTAGLAALETDARLDGPQEVIATQAVHDLDYQTHFERRMRLSGKKIYRSKFVRL